jgi:hypothetical protein
MGGRVSPPPGIDADDEGDAVKQPELFAFEVELSQPPFTGDDPSASITAFIRPLDEAGKLLRLRACELLNSQLAAG